MNLQNLFWQIQENNETVLKQDSPLGILLWKELLKVHPADIARFFSDTEPATAAKLFTQLPHEIKIETFQNLTTNLKIRGLSLLNDHDRSQLLGSLPIDELTDFFDELSDEELKNYLKLLHKKDREKVFSLLQFNPESAGGIMDTDVLTLIQDFTIEKSIQILQRLQPKIELHRVIYVTTQDNELSGHIVLEDLVLQSPKSRLSAILRKNELVVGVHEDQEAIAHKMVHYSLMTVPVVDDHFNFLGVIPSETLVHVLEQEAAEDVYRISAVGSMKDTYLETPFFGLLYQRASILVSLLLLQTFSSMIMEYYQATLAGFLYFFTSMITSTGGNTSSQSSAIVIQGLTSGEISSSNIKKFFWRELRMALVIAVILSIVSFIRVYFTHPGHGWEAIAVSLSLGAIVMVSVMLGSFIPILLKKLRLDPAFSAGPFLATIMDILGLFIYCYISKILLS